MSLGFMPSQTDHPRVGGEKTDDHLKGLRDLGSPPHGRGKGLLGGGLTGLGGITPAWAGKSGKGARSDGGCWDHPRVSGEKR